MYCQEQQVFILGFFKTPSVAIDLHFMNRQGSQFQLKIFINVRKINHPTYLMARR